MLDIPNEYILLKMDCAKEAQHVLFMADNKDGYIDKLIKKATDLN